MAEIKKPKLTEYRSLHKGTHHQVKEKGTKTFSWDYEVRRDRRISKLTIQEFEIVEGERKDKGDAISFKDIYCVLSRHQAREFVRNLKK